MRVFLLLIALALTALEAHWLGGAAGLRVWLMVIGPMLGGLVFILALVAAYDALARLFTSQNDEMTIYGYRHNVRR